MSIVKASGSLDPERPARSVPLTVMVCSPSSSGVAGTNGEEHGVGTASSTEQKKVTGRLATKATRGLGLELRSAGDSVISTSGGRATRPTASRASTRPAPTTSGPRLPIGLALAARAVRIWATVIAGFASRISAATAAAWGAAAEVPQNRLIPGV